MDSRKLAVLVLVMVFVAGCFDLGFENRVERLSADVDQQKFTGVWDLESAPLLPDDSIWVKQAKVTPRGGELEVVLVARNSEEFPMRMVVSLVGGHEIAFLRQALSWNAARLTLDGDGQRVRVYLLDHDRLSTDVQSGALAGSVLLVDSFHRQTAVTASSTQLRAYFEGNPGFIGDVSDQPFLVFRKK